MNPQSDGKVAQTVDRAVHSSYSDSQEDNCLSDIRQSLRRVLQKQILELDGCRLSQYLKLHPQMAFSEMV